MLSDVPTVCDKELTQLQFFTPYSCSFDNISFPVHRHSRTPAKESEKYLIKRHPYQPDTLYMVSLLLEFLLCLLRLLEARTLAVLA